MTWAAVRPTAQSERLEWEAWAARQSPTVRKAWEEVRALRRKARALERVADRAYEAAVVEWGGAETAAWMEAQAAADVAADVAGDAGDVAGERAWRLERREAREGDEL